MPTSTVCWAEHRRARCRSPRAREAPAQQRRQRHAVDVAAPGGLGRVHVAVGVHPDQAERIGRRVAAPRPRWPPPIPPPGCDRRRGPRAGHRPPAPRKRRRIRGGRRRRCRPRTSCARRRACPIRAAARARCRGPRRRGRAGRSDRPVRRCGTPTVPCPRRAVRRRDPAARRSGAPASCEPFYRGLKPGAGSREPVTGPSHSWMRVAVARP